MSTTYYVIARSQHEAENELLRGNWYPNPAWAQKELDKAGLHEDNSLYTVYSVQIPS